MWDGGAIRRKTLEQRRRQQQVPSSVGIFPLSRCRRRCRLHFHFNDNVMILKIWLLFDSREDSLLLLFHYCNMTSNCLWFSSLQPLPVVGRFHRVRFTSIFSSSEITIRWCLLQRWLVTTAEREESLTFHFAMIIIVIVIVSVEVVSSLTPTSEKK